MSNEPITPANKIITLMTISILMKDLSLEYIGTPSGQKCYDSFLETIDFAKKVIEKEMPELYLHHLEELSMAKNTLSTLSDEDKLKWLEKLELIEFPEVENK